MPEPQQGLADSHISANFKFFNTGELMKWQDKFEEFRSVFNRFSEALHKKHLSEAEQEDLVQNLNLTVEKGFQTLQKFMQQEDAPGKATANDSNDFKDDLKEIKKSFESDELIKLKHDRQYLHENEWEVREVVYPAFKELHDYLESRR